MSLRVAPSAFFVFVFWAVAVTLLALNLLVEIGITRHLLQFGYLYIILVFCVVVWAGNVVLGCDDHSFLLLDLASFLICFLPLFHVDD